LTNSDICFCIAGGGKIVCFGVQSPGVSPYLDATEKINPETNSVSEVTDT